VYYCMCVILLQDWAKTEASRGDRIMIGDDEVTGGQDGSVLVGLSGG
jgi:hypothetical protein